MPDAQIIDTTGIDYALLDSLLLGKDGHVKCFDAEFYRTINPLHLRAWCVERGRYQMVTRELVDWLREQIGDRKAIEIGAGCGDLGHHLGITMTDSYQQVEQKEIVAYYKALRQEPTKPPATVIKEDGETAVRKRKPDVVIAAWVTEKWREGEAKGNAFGPRGDYILERCGRYILIGNDNVHGGRPLMKAAHATHRFPWLVSRAADPSKNAIYVWENTKWKR